MTRCITALVLVPVVVRLADVSRPLGHRGMRGVGRCGLQRCIAAVVLVALVAGCSGDATAEPSSSVVAREITVAAASDLRPAFEELASTFTAESGTAVRFSFGSSGQLREQVVNGAPFDLFASANVDYVDEVLDAGRGDPDTKADYAIGRIALWAAPPAPLPARVEDLATAAYERIAIANPEHAPYGLAAEQALRSAGIHDEVEARLVFGENVSDALRIARSGNADVGIVSLSLALAEGGDHVVVPAELHEPLRQALVVTGTGARGEAARAFAALVSSPGGRAVMVRHGFTLPGDAGPSG